MKVNSEKIFNRIGIVCILVLSLSFIASTGYCFYLTDKLGEYRQQLELARSRTEQYEDIIESARNTNTELNECLNRSSTSLSELREQIHTVRKYCEEMESRLHLLGDDNSNTIGNDSSTN